MATTTNMNSWRQYSPHPEERFGTTYECFIPYGYFTRLKARYDDPLSVRQNLTLRSDGADCPLPINRKGRR
jgi:hypothetical protein